MLTSTGKNSVHKLDFDVLTFAVVFLRLFRGVVDTDLFKSAKVQLYVVIDSNKN